MIHDDDVINQLLNTKFIPNQTILDNEIKKVN
jgi:hypothetical protein